MARTPTSCTSARSIAVRPPSLKGRTARLLRIHLLEVGPTLGLARWHEDGSKRLLEGTRRRLRLGTHTQRNSEPGSAGGMVGSSGKRYRPTSACACLPYLRQSLSSTAAAPAPRSLPSPPARATAGGRLRAGWGRKASGRDFLCAEFRLDTYLVSISICNP